MQNVPDPYRLLGVSRDASIDQIKAAHRRLAKRYHPDAPQGNRAQFLAVQEAYQLLADPLRRRQWDARHAGGPVRADDQPGRTRPRPGNGHTAGREDRRGASVEDRASRTWSARGVPWWQEAAGPGRAAPGRTDRADRTGSASRPGERATNAGTSGASEGPGARRASGTESQRTHARAADSTAQEPAPSRRAQAGQSGSRGGRRQRGPRRTEGDGASDFDVYSRSSGAAWSSAARAYFRRGVDDLPRGRAAWATRPRPRRGPLESDEATEGGSASQDAESSAEGRGPWGSAPSSEQGRHGASAAFGSGPAAGRPRTTPQEPERRAATGASTAGPMLGTTPRFTSQGPHASLARAKRWAIEGRELWPPLFQRLVFAVAGWLPPALGLAYTSGSVSGCDRAAVSCPANFELLQLLGVAGLLAALLFLPKAAYLAAAGSAGLAFTAALLVIVYSVAGVAQPLPQPFAVVTLALWLAGYVFGAFAAANDWPVSRPWAGESWLTGPGGRPPSLGVARRVSRSRLGGR